MKKNRRRGRSSTSQDDLTMFKDDVADSNLLAALRMLTQPVPTGNADAAYRRSPAHWVVLWPHRPMLLCAANRPPQDDRTDIVIVERRTFLDDLKFRMGVRLHWDIFWHGDFRLFQPANGPAVFVSHPHDLPLAFRIDEDGALEADYFRPYASWDEYRAGCDRAVEALQALIVLPRAA
jgi:hypothetical protein